MAELESQSQQGATETLDFNDFSALLSKEFKPGTEAANQVSSAVTTLPNMLYRMFPKFLTMRSRPYSQLSPL